MENAKIKTAVIGVGHLGSAHARLYSKIQGCKLVGVCDSNLRRAKLISKLYNTSFEADYRNLIGKVDAVSVVVPTLNHYEISKYFLERGVSVLVEKPMTNTLEEADELLNLAKKNNLTLQVGHVERFNAAVEFIQDKLSGCRFIECQRLGPFSKRGTDVGIVLDLMIHDIDIVLAMVGSKIERIDAIGVSVMTKHEDIANVRINFENKTVCNLSASRVTKDTTRKIRIFSKDSYISLDYIRQQAVICTKSANRIIRKQINIKKQEPLKRELESFIECIKTKKEPLVSGEQGRNALAVALEIQRQIREKWNNN